MDKHTVVIVDDEKPARDRIGFMLEEYSDFTIIGEAANGEDALRILEKKRPDVLFLDIQMPVLTGFDLIELLGTARLPIIVFITAYDNHAVKAFEVNALDYILKPFDKSRFKQTIEKIRNTERTAREYRNQVQNLIADHSGKGYLKRLLIRDRSKVAVIKTVDITYIKACGNYVNVCTEQKEYLYRATMKEMERTLDPAEFVRIHRSYIININQIKEIEPLLNNDFRVTLSNRTKLTLSRRYYPKVKKHLHLN